MTSADDIQSRYKRSIEDENVEEFKKILQETKTYPNSELTGIIKKLVLMDFLEVIRLHSFIELDIDTDKTALTDHRIDIINVKRENIYKLIKTIAITAPLGIQLSYMQDILNILILENENISPDDIKYAKLLLFIIFITRQPVWNVFTILKDKTLSPNIVRYIDLLKETGHLSEFNLSMFLIQQNEEEILQYVLQLVLKPNNTFVQCLTLCLHVARTTASWSNETYHSTCNVSFNKFIDNLLDEHSELTDLLAFPIIRVMAFKETYNHSFLRLVEKNLPKRTNQFEMIEMMKMIIVSKNEELLNMFLRTIPGIPGYEIALDIFVSFIINVCQKLQGHYPLQSSENIFLLFQAKPKYLFFEGASKLIGTNFSPQQIISLIDYINTERNTEQCIVRCKLIEEIIIARIKSHKYSMPQYDGFSDANHDSFFDKFKEHITPKVIETMIKYFFTIPEQFIEQCEAFTRQNPKPFLSNLIRYFALSSVRRPPSAPEFKPINLTSEYANYFQFSNDILSIGNKQYHLTLSTSAQDLTFSVVIYEITTNIPKTCYKCLTVLSSSLTDAPDNALSGADDSIRVYVNKANRKIFSCSTCKDDSFSLAFCATCRDSIERSTTITHCDHTFCTECLTTSLKYNPVCPSCGLSVTPRKLVTEDEVIDTFLDTYGSAISTFHNLRL